MAEPLTDGGDVEFATLAEKLHWGMFKIAAAYRRREYARINSEDLTLTQCAILYHLRENGPLRVTDLAELENVTTATMTTAVGRLEHLGMVVRRRDAADRRLIHIELTPSGDDAPRQAVSELALAMRGVMTDADMTALVAAIEPLQALAKLGEASYGRSR